MKFFSRDTRAKLVRLLAVLSFVYLCAIGLLVLGESDMVYRPIDGGPSDPAKAGFANYKVRSVTLKDQAPIIYWENAAPANAPTVIYFHGNSGGLYVHERALRFMDDAKLHVIAMEYPGYPGVPGESSEPLLVNQATALFDAISKETKRKPTIWGYSLGTGIAVQLAARRTPQSLVLEAPFSSVVKRAGELFPYAPVGKLMKNQFRSRDYIGKVHTPLLIVHGTTDSIIPIHHSEELFARANQPKIFKSYDDYGHLNLFKSGAYEDADAFIRQYALIGPTPPQTTP